MLKRKPNEHMAKASSRSTAHDGSVACILVRAGRNCVHCVLGVTEMKTTLCRGVIPGTLFSMEFEGAIGDIPRMLSFLQNRGFTYIEKLVEEIPLTFTTPVGQEATRGFFTER